MLGIFRPGGYTPVSILSRRMAGLLESRQIPFRKVGRHRRITFEALMEYKRQEDLKRRAAADDLADLSQELGLY